MVLLQQHDPTVAGGPEPHHGRVVAEEQVARDQAALEQELGVGPGQLPRGQERALDAVGLERDSGAVLQVARLLGAELLREGALRHVAGQAHPRGDHHVAERRLAVQPAGIGVEERLQASVHGAIVARANP